MLKGVHLLELTYSEGNTQVIRDCDANNFRKNRTIKVPIDNYEVLFNNFSKFVVFGLTHIFCSVLLTVWVLCGLTAPVPCWHLFYFYYSLGRL